MSRVTPEVEQVLRDLNPWWRDPADVRPAPPAYRRRHVRGIVDALARPKSLIHVLRGPRQVGKTTALYQVVQDLIGRGVPPRAILLVRFDLEPLRTVGILPIARWHDEAVRQPGADEPPVLLLDEVHKLRRWDEEVKHLFDTFPVRVVLTGSSSVLVARGQRESLAFRATTIDFPPFLFREVLEAWTPDLADALPDPIGFLDCFTPGFAPEGVFDALRRHPPERVRSWRRRLDRYYNRGGYPRLHSGEIDDDRWADYLVESVFERVLGVDIPDLFPVDQPQLLRQIYLAVARQSGREIAQNGLANDLNAAGFRTNQPLVGRYLHYLADALLIREFRRYPLGRRKNARVPVKITLTDLGVRNAIFRGAPSLWESAPDVVGPLVETMLQTVLRGPGLQTHFYRDHRVAGDPRSAMDEVDFVVEATDGAVIPVECKFRKRIDPEDAGDVARFRARFDAPFGVLVTRDDFRWDPRDRILHVPLLTFLLAF